jgi:S1-C subfamily serine protease
MKDLVKNFVRLFVLFALLTSSAIAFAQDDSETETRVLPFIGVRYWGVEEGVLVTGVISNTPAEGADLEVGDVITAIDEAAVNVGSIQEVVWSHEVGETISLAGNRDGTAFATDVTLMAYPEDLSSNPGFVIPLDLASVGLFVGQCNDKVVVIGVLADSQFSEAGFRMTDVLMSVDGDAIDSIGAADAAVSDLSEGDELVLTVLRDDQELVIKVLVEDHRGRHPRKGRRPRQRPRLEIGSTYVTDSIGLGYSENAIQILKLKPAHEWYVGGLRQFDVITAANDAPFAEANTLFTGESIKLTVERAAGTLHFDVPSSSAPLLMFGLDAPASQDRSVWLGLHEKQVTLGVRFIQLEETSPYFEGSDVKQGAYIAEVIDGLPAGAAGIQVGDIIVAVEGEAATLEIDLRNRIYFHKPGDSVTLDVLRDGEIVKVEVVLRVAS